MHWQSKEFLVSKRLNAISPIDGRYGNATKSLSPYFSESGLMRYRLLIEVEYLIALSEEKKIYELAHFSKLQIKRFRNIYLKFSSDDAKKIKEIEKTTNHDVKAIEYFLHNKIKKQLHPWVHFCLTSEDINNLAYSMMWKDALEEIYLPKLILVHKQLKTFAKKYKKLPLLSLTHGQPATPTTFGKELAVFYKRLNRQLGQLKTQNFFGKFGGATGTWSAHVVAYPKVNWVSFAERFVKKLGLKLNFITTQIEPHDSLSESFHQIIRVNNILIDFCRDTWLYISRGLLAQKKVSGEIGSSTMPHKINPIQFENAEGNLELANKLLGHLATKLPVSRMQRDLTDSTTIRNQGVAMSHSFLGLSNILIGLNRITVNKSQINAELENHWEVLAEAVQTLLRKAGKPDAYEKLKSITQGKSVDVETVAEFVSGLNLSEQDTQTLLTLTPSSYIGLSSELVDKI